jgi:hypothetical protein
MITDIKDQVVELFVQMGCRTQKMDKKVILIF